jgi:hypothetical protein
MSTITRRGASILFLTLWLLVTCATPEALPTPQPTATLTLTAKVTSTPTPDPCTGWRCSIHGVAYTGAIDAANTLNDASVTLTQSSYCSPTAGQYQTTTAPDGTFTFDEIFLHDTDGLSIDVEYEGHEPARWKTAGSACVSCSCFSSPIEIVLLTTEPEPTPTLLPLIEQHNDVIAFVSNTRIYVVTADGTAMEQLVRYTITPSGLAWSPDGR